MIQEATTTMLKYFWIKVIAAIPVGYFVLTETHLTVAYGLFFIIILDTILGVWVAIKEKKFSSWRLGRVAAKISRYSIALTTVHILGVVSPIFTWTFHYLGVFLVLTEVISNFEKLALLGFKTPMFLLSKLNSEFKKLYEGDESAKSVIFKKE